MNREQWTEILGTGNWIATRQDQQRVYEKMRRAGYEPSDVYHDIEMKSYYVDTHRDISFEGAEIHLHTHSFYEFLCVQSVCGMEYMLGTECVTIQRGDILLIPPGVPHCPLLPKKMPGPYDRDVLWISQALMEITRRQLEHPFSPSGRACHLRTAGTQWSHLPQMFRSGVREAQEGSPLWEVAVLGNTLMLISDLRRFLLDHRPAPIPSREPQLLERVLTYVDRHYWQKITLAQIAESCFVSESTVSHTFREKMGVSFSHYLTQRRLIASKDLILAGKPLEDVGKAVGFTDYSAFYRAFKREYGMSPRKFRDLSAKDG